MDDGQDEVLAAQMVRLGTRLIDAQAEVQEAAAIAVDMVGQPRISPAAVETLLRRLEEIRRLLADAIPPELILAVEGPGRGGDRR
jgi:hypothetical protein